MNLAKLGDDSAIQHGASGAPGMVVIGAFLINGRGIVIERSMAER